MLLKTKLSVSTKVTLLFAVVIFTMMNVSPVYAGEKEMAGLIAKKAAIIKSMHKKAKKALVNSAQDKLFDAYFSAGDDAQREGVKGKIEQLTLKVQSKFHVAEMCLIDAEGIEHTRITGNEIAPDDDLSKDETGAVFFTPSFAQRPKTVHIAPPYLSPDAAKWVLSYTTPIVVDGEISAILHYEHGLDVYQNALNKGMSGDSPYMLAVSGEGFIISDSRKAIKYDAQGDKEAQADYFEPVDDALKSVLGKKKGVKTLTLNGGQYAVGHSKSLGGWTILAIQKL